jgi:DNA-binding IclR family transcriptional regulator
VRQLDQVDIRTIAHPHIAELASEVGHTVHLVSLIDHQVVYVDKGDGSGPMRLRSQVGRPVDLHTAGVGNVILAHLESPLQQELLKTVTYRAPEDNSLCATQHHGAAIRINVLETGIVISGEQSD